VGLIPCSVCRQRPEDKLCQVTWAWNPQPRTRMAFRQRLCINCFCARLLVFDKPIEPTGALTCPSCGIDTEADMEPVYATAFVPKAGRMAYELPLCPSCAVEVRVRAQEHAELLPERDPESRGQAPSTPLVPSAWERLGIRPRE
jgi:hypothetical protein